ncbi:MAG: aspartyl beta-hydroxylase [Lactimicrobium sp.]|uniref:aspartyl beta-hydroxylase n=1 Tax=Lactimicrobium sp. TaxID=2563780 RepID=UPI002F354443
MELTDGLKKLMLAGVGAAAFTAEKASDVVDTLVKKGELTVEQGKALNTELKHKAEEVKKEKEEKPEEKEEKKDFASMVDGLSEEELASLKSAISAHDEKKDA